MKKLALITVIFKNYTILDDYFASLSKQTDLDFHLYILDLTPEPQSYMYPAYVTLIQDQNKGYASGVNRGIKRALDEGYEILAPMNCDVLVDESFIQNIKQSVYQHPSTIIGGKIYYAPGYEFHNKRYPQDVLGKVLWYAGGLIDWNNVFTTHRGVDEIEQGQYDSTEKTTFITGCFMAFDKSVVEKIGYWDEGYFLFYEDADYCARATQNGISLIYDPSIVIWHKSGQSTSGAASDFQQKYLGRNRMRFGLKYAPLKTKLHLIKNQILKSIFK